MLPVDGCMAERAVFERPQFMLVGLVPAYRAFPISTVGDRLPSYNAYLRGNVAALLFDSILPRKIILHA